MIIELSQLRDQFCRCRWLSAMVRCYGNRSIGDTEKLCPRPGHS